MTRPTLPADWQARKEFAKRNYPKLESLATQASLHVSSSEQFDCNLGQHWKATVILPYALSDVDHLEHTVQEAANIAKATPLGSIAKKFSNGNMAAIEIIAESHISVFYVNDAAKPYLLVDAYTCGSTMQSCAAIEHICKTYHGTLTDPFEVKRGVMIKPTPDSPSVFARGLASLEGQNLKFFKSKNFNPKTTVAQHLLLEAYQCDFDAINSLDNVTAGFANILRQFDITTHQQHPVKFEPQGLSNVILGENCIMTIHTWPEAPFQYAAIDVLSVNNALDLTATKAMLKDLLQMGKCSYLTVNRGKTIFPQEITFTHEAKSPTPVYRGTR